MRKAALLALPLVLSGCSGFGKFWHDTLTFPGANPNGPMGDSENMLRARGEVAQTLPILPKGGNIWPGPPQALPSLGDVESRNGLAGAIGNPDTFIGGGSVGGAPLGEGDSLRAGEENDIRNGVQDFSSGPGMQNAPVAALPNHEQDNAAKYGAKQRTSTIIIPNGDGTNTLIAPDGSVRVTKGSPPKQ